MTPRRIARKLLVALSALAALALVFGGVTLLRTTRFRSSAWAGEWQRTYAPNTAADAVPDAAAADALDQLARAAERLAGRATRYDGAYVAIAYPSGDVPVDTGVCTDLVVRAYRAVGVDLQQIVHEDMASHFEAYPALWNVSAADANIDHRRVPNLMVWFARHADVLPVTSRGADYRPGDVVAWDFGGGLTHIGIVATSRAAGTGRPLVAHHAGGNPRVGDDLFKWPILAHYRYAGGSTR